MSGRLACLLALLCLSLTACEGFSFFPDRSKLAIEPYAAMLKPSGSASMQSVVGPGPVDQPSVDLGDGLNLVDRQFSYGALFNYGDNFAGLELGFSYWEHTNVTTDGSLDYDFGELDQGDDVQTYAPTDRVCPQLQRRTRHGVMKQITACHRAASTASETARRRPRRRPPTARSSPSSASPSR
jgi:hypothetical protein